MKVAIVLYDGFDDLDAVGPYEILRMAAEAGAPLDVRLVTASAADRVTSSHGLEVLPQGLLDGTADLVIVPGGSWLARAEVGAWGEIQRGALPRALAAEHARGASLAAVCTGTMLLSAAGLARGRPATTHHRALDALRAEGADLVDARVVDDGDLVTSGGVTSGLDMALWLVERHFGPELATRIASRIEHDRRGRVHRSERPRTLRTGPGSADPNQ
jgi:transcriptional regulator GlxA family with amidase domain